MEIYSKKAFQNDHRHQSHDDRPKQHVENAYFVIDVFSTFGADDKHFPLD